MDNVNNRKNWLRETFPKDWKEANDIQEDTSKLSETHNQFYAVGADNGVIRRFKVILRNGRVYSLPYSLLPVLIRKDDSELVILIYSYVITLTGRNMSAVEDTLSNETLLWVKESPSGKDDGEAFVFISKIVIADKD